MLEFGGTSLLNPPETRRVAGDSQEQVRVELRDASVNDVQVTPASTSVLPGRVIQIMPLAGILLVVVNFQRNVAEVLAVRGF